MAKLKRRPKGGPPRPDPPRDSPPGGYSFGSPYQGGPIFSDAFRSRLSPSPWDLIENYRSIAFAMIARKRDAVSKITLRLFCDSSRRTPGPGGRRLGDPRDGADPHPVGRSTIVRHVRDGMVGPGSVDHVTEIRNHPILDALDDPDGQGYFSRRKLIGLICTYQDVIGHAFLVPDGGPWGDYEDPSRSGPPKRLWFLLPQYVLPYREAGSPLIAAWQYFKDKLPYQSVVWFRHSISLRDCYASSFSPLAAGETYRDQEDRFMAIFDQILGDGPRPSMLLSPKDANMPLGEVERKRLEYDALRRHSGGNAGKVMVTNSAVDVTPLSYQPADLAAMHISEYDRTNLAAIFGLPPTYFTTETNLANLEAADAFFARFAVEPMCATIAETLTWLVRQWDPRLYFQFDPVLADDELKEAQINKIYWDMGCRTANQINEESKYPPAPWGAEPMFNKNMVPWSVLKEQAQQSLDAAKAKMDSDAKMLEYQLSPDDQPEPDAEGPDAAEAEAKAAEERSLAARLYELARSA